MKKQYQYDKNVKMREGFAMMDAIMAIGVLLTIILISYAIYAKQKVPADIRVASSTADTIIQGIENARSEYNGGDYVGGSGDFGSIDKLRYALGGEEAVAKLSGWSYDCGGGTVSFTSPSLGNEDIAGGVKEAINSKYTSWEAESDGSSVTVSKPGTCSDND